MKSEKTVKIPLLLFLILTVLISTIFPLSQIAVSAGETSSTLQVCVTPKAHTATTVGDVFTVDVTIADVTNLQGFELKLAYNTAILDAAEVREGPFLKSFGTTFSFKTEANETLGYVWVAIVLLSATPAQGDGTLATVTFESTDVGESSFDLYDIKLGDPNGLPIESDVDCPQSYDVIGPPDWSYTFRYQYWPSPPEVDPCPLPGGIVDGFCFDKMINVTNAYVDGQAAAAGWKVGFINSTTVVFSAEDVMTSGQWSGFHIVAPDATDGTVDWFCDHGAGTQADDDLLHGPNPPSPPTPPTPYLKCDFNYDGYVDELDLELLIAVFGDEGPPGWIPQDLNSDGFIDILDAITFSNCPNFRDRRPPVTTISLDGTQGAQGWYISDVIVTMTATDSFSGVNKTEYSYDNLTWNTYTAPFLITAEGTMTVYYKSIDNKGNIEEVKTQSVKIDKTPPEITIDSPQATEYSEGGSLPVTYAASDVLSGMALVNASIGYDPATIYVDPNVRDVAVGEDISINVSIADASNVCGIAFILNWDPTILTGVNIEIPEDHFMKPDGDEANLWIIMKQIQAGYARYVVTYGDVDRAIALGYAPKNGSGTLANITLHCASVGTSQLYINGTMIGDAQGNLLDHVVIHGLVTVSAGPENHDIAVTGVTASPTTVITGDSVLINVVVENQGTRTETFDVSVFYDSTLISTETGVTLDWGATTTLTFTWNTTGVPMGVYRITAEASAVPDETDLTDNTYINGVINVQIPVNSGQTLNLSGWTTGKYTLTVKAIDNAGNTAENSVVFHVVFTLTSTVTDEYTKEPIEGVGITLHETGESATTDEDGRASFTIRTAGPYTVQMTVPGGYMTHDDATKFIEVTRTTEVDFTLYQASWSGGRSPATHGFWANWNNHYTYEQMQTLLAHAQSASGLFKDLTVDQLASYLASSDTLSQKEKGKVQLLTSWLNVVSTRLGVDVRVDLHSVRGWEQVINTPVSTMLVKDLLKKIDDLYLTNAELTDTQWETVKNILDRLNNRQLFELPLRCGRTFQEGN